MIKKIISVMLLVFVSIVYSHAEITGINFSRVADRVFDIFVTATSTEQVQSQKFFFSSSAVTSPVEDISQYTVFYETNVFVSVAPFEVDKLVYHDIYFRFACGIKTGGVWSYTFSGSTYVWFTSVWYDVDGDGILEEAKETGYRNDGYDIYRDENFNSQIFKLLDADADGKKDFFIDIDLDNKPDVLWIPDKNKLYTLTRFNVDRDGYYEYIINFPDEKKFLDVQENKIKSFCKIKGEITDLGGLPVSVAKIEIFAGNELVDYTFSDEGKYEITLTVVDYNDYYKITCTKKGYTFMSESLWLNHDTLYTVNFRISLSDVGLNDVLLYPNPVKKNQPLKLSFNFQEKTPVEIVVYDISGAPVMTLFKEIVSEKQTGAVIEHGLPEGYYYFVTIIAGERKITKVKIVP